MQPLYRSGTENMPALCLHLTQYRIFSEYARDAELILIYEVNKQIEGGAAELIVIQHFRLVMLWTHVILKHSGFTHTRHAGGKTVAK